jgi:hypothetical protein
MSVPTITSKEIALAEYPTHSKHYRSTDAVRTAAEQLSRKKSKGIKITIN